MSGRAFFLSGEEATISEFVGFVLEPNFESFLHQIFVENLKADTRFSGTVFYKLRFAIIIGLGRSPNQSKHPVAAICVSSLIIDGTTIRSKFGKVFSPIAA